MRSQKETNNTLRGSKRWYDDACGTAFALELIGERWSILILRELMFGPRRFSELRAGLPGISAKILTMRLVSLEQKRVLVKRQMPPPISAQLYELTEWGYEAEDLIQMLGKWATRHPGHDPTLPLSSASIMMSFRTMIDASQAKSLDVKAGFHLGDDRFTVTIKNGEIITQRQEPKDVDFLLIAQPTIIAAAVYGGVPLSDLEPDGLLTIQGDRKLAARFTKLFILPKKLNTIVDC